MKFFAKLKILAFASVDFFSFFFFFFSFVFFVLLVFIKTKKMEVDNKTTNPTPITDDKKRKREEDDQPIDEKAENQQKEEEKEEKENYFEELRSEPFPKTSNRCFFDMVEGKKIDHVPVWLMRQAGLYLPEYKEVRRRNDFFTICRTPKLACEVTLQPIDRFTGLDASIIFSDILVVPQALGMECVFISGKGPTFPKAIKREDDLEDLLERVRERKERGEKGVDIKDKLGYVLDAITLTRVKLRGRVPLLGFCGSPWTLMAYMMEGQGSHTFPVPKSFLYSFPNKSKELLGVLADVLVDFLIAQWEAGAEGLMVFDSHGGQLSPAMYKEFSLPFLKDIVKRVKEGIKNRWEELKVERRAAREERKKKEQEKKEEDKQENDDDKMQIDEEQQQREKEQEEYEEGECPFVPMGVFSKGSHYALEMLSESGYDIVGLDWTIDPSEAVKRTGNKVCLQGNLDPCALYGPRGVVREEVEKMFEGFKGGRLLANLGHGVHHEHRPSAVLDFVEAVHDYSYVFFGEDKPEEGEKKEGEEKEEKE